jgi:hypothetical protein
LSDRQQPWSVLKTSGRPYFQSGVEGLQAELAVEAAFNYAFALKSKRRRKSRPAA